MNKFWYKWKDIWVSYPTTVKEAGSAFFDTFLHLFALSLPLTFPLAYGIYQLCLKMKSKFRR